MALAAAHRRRLSARRRRLRADEDKEVKPEDEDTEVKPEDEEVKPEDEDKEVKPEDKEEQSWWDKLSADEQDAYLTRHPRSRRRKTHVKGSLLRHAVMVSSNRVHHAVRAIGKSYRRGMRGIRNLKAGKPMSGAEKEGLKKVGLVVATVVVAALAAAALFTPLGGAAVDVSTDYLNWLHEQYANTGQASDGPASASPSDRSALKEFHDGMLKWLLDQPASTLAEKYGEKA